jgi:putative ABC transport system permease protein
MLLAVWGTAFLMSGLPAGLDLPRTREIAVDQRFLLFGCIVTTLTGIVFGLLPSISSARSASQSALRQATRGATASRNRITSGLIVSEVALAVVLLTGAGLLGRSFWELSRVHPGFEAEQVLTMRTTLPPSRYENRDRIRVFTEALLTRIENLPGVRAVGSANYVPMSNVGVGGSFEIVGRPTPPIGEQPGSWISVVGGRYFEVMGIPLLRGRLPGPADTERTQAVVVIDEELARRHWPGEDPIGTRLTWRKGEGERLSGEIIGVVGSVRWASMARKPNAMRYFWFSQDPDREITIAARVVGDPVRVGDLMSAQVREIDPNQAVAEIRAMQDFVSADLVRPRFMMLLLGSFAGAALLLAAIGVYGVIAFGVTQRTREIGVRVALGAQHRDVLRLVMRRGMFLIGTGLAIGIATSLALGRVVAGLLYGVTPRDPATLVTVAVFLTVVAMLATYFPARRATRVDPMVALRAE